jgi:hypothetical protein
MGVLSGLNDEPVKERYPFIEEGSYELELESLVEGKWFKSKTEFYAGNFKVVESTNPKFPSGSTVQVAHGKVFEDYFKRNVFEMGAAILNRPVSSMTLNIADKMLKAEELKNLKGRKVKVTVEKQLSEKSGKEFAQYTWTPVSPPLK